VIFLHELCLCTKQQQQQEQQQVTSYKSLFRVWRWRDCKGFFLSRENVFILQSTFTVVILHCNFYVICNSTL
jgi:hypothetical protein